MAEFIFREKPKLTELKSKVTSIKNNIITLDKTIFFAFAGGQESDEGIINDIEVTEARKEGTEIFYTLKETPNFKVGDEVETKINKEKREKTMRLHSGLHIVADFFEREQNIPPKELLGSNVNDSKGRLDYNYPESISPLLEDLQNKVNTFIEEGHEVQHLPNEGDKWEWKCENFTCPCGGTHVRNTKEIGKLRLKRKNCGKNKERIEVFLL